MNTQTVLTKSHHKYMIAFYRGQLDNYSSDLYNLLTLDQITGSDHTANINYIQKQINRLNDKIAFHKRFLI